MLPSLPMGGFLAWSFSVLLCVSLSPSPDKSGQVVAVLNFCSYIAYFAVNFFSTSLIS